MDCIKFLNEVYILEYLIMILIAQILQHTLQWKLLITWLVTAWETVIIFEYLL